LSVSKFGSRHIASVAVDFSKILLVLTGHSALPLLSDRMRTPLFILGWTLVAATCDPARAEAGPATPQRKLEAALLEAARASCPKNTIRLDSDLTRAARRYIEDGKMASGAPDGSGLAFYASLESIDPAPTGGVATVDNPLQADRAVGDLLPRSCHYNVAGVASGRTASGHGVVAVLTAQRSVQLIAMPSRVPPGTAVHLEGSLSAGLEQPRLYHLLPGATVEETPIPEDGAAHFSLDILLREKGEHSIELLADGRGGPEVIALRRIFVGVQPPTGPPAVSTAAPEHGDALTQVEQAIARLRAAHGLPALERDKALDAIALEHSRNMAHTRTFAHVLRIDGSLGDRLVKAGYANHFAGENIGLADDPLEAHKAIEGSPAHLMNLLDPRHSRLGLGASPGTSPDGEPAVYLTEVLSQPIISSKDPAADVVKFIAAERKRRKLAPLLRDPRLDELAQARIRKLAAAGGELVEPDITSLALAKIATIVSAAAEQLIVGAPEDVKISRDVTNKSWALLGVGAVYASSKEYGPDRLWLLLVYAR
jgi:uncharacterized protein YkwD